MEKYEIKKNDVKLSWREKDGHAEYCVFLETTCMHFIFYRNKVNTGFN